MFTLSAQYQLANNNNNNNNNNNDNNNNDDDNKVAKGGLLYIVISKRYCQLSTDQSVTIKWSKKQLDSGSITLDPLCYLLTY